MKKLLFLGGALSLLLAHEVAAQAKTTPAGMKYEILKDVAGVPGNIGEVVKFHIVIQNSEGTILQNSAQMSPEPQVDMIKKSEFPWSYEEIFTLISPGDSAVVYVPSDSIFSPKFGQQRPPSIAEHTEIKFAFKLVNIMTMQAFEAEAKVKAEAAQAAEEGNLTGFIQKNKLVAKRTESGLYFVSKKKGNGVKPKVGDKVKVHYTGYLLDSTKFDSSVDRGEPFAFELGAHQVIAGWDEGIAMMSKGEKATLLIPSKLGYGERGAGGSIGPNASLMFDVELVDFTSKDGSSTTTTPAKSAVKKTPAKKPATIDKSKLNKPAAKPQTKGKTQLK
jgi:FKBP-type peptidyl-prolyl cis-trans isomerase FkpA